MWIQIRRGEGKKKSIITYCLFQTVRYTLIKYDCLHTRFIRCETPKIVSDRKKNARGSCWQILDALTCGVFSNSEPDLHYLVSRRLSSPLHITCLALANNLTIFTYSGLLVSLLCPNPCLGSVEGILKKSWSSQCRECYDRLITPPLALD